MTGAQAASVVLDGLTVLGNGDASVLFCNAGNSSIPNLTIVNCSFANANQEGIFIEKCNLNLTRSCIQHVNQVGLLLGFGSTDFVESVFIWNNSTGVDFKSGNGTFAFNAIAYNTGTNGVNCGVPSSVISDSIVYGNMMTAGSQFMTAGGGSCTLSNVVTGVDSIASAGKITASPVFKNPTDLHLDTSVANLAANQACCIDKISAAGPSPSPSPLPALDIDGSARPKGARWDIGAHEAM